MAKDKRGSGKEHLELPRRDSSGNGASKDSKQEDKEPKATKANLELDSWQHDILAAKGNVLLCTGRQVGKTTIFAIKAAERMVEKRGSRIIVASLTEDQAQLIIIMILTHLERNYKKMIARKKKAPTKSSITLTNGSKVIARPVGNTGDAIRGFTGDVLIPDEASRMPETMWLAAKPTLLTTAGEIWMCSTPFGKQGYFYDCFQNKHDRFKVFHVSSEQVIKDRAISDTWSEQQRIAALRFLEEEKNDMSDLQYAQEYLGQFIDDLRQLFSDQIIAQACTLGKSGVSIRHQHFLGCDIARMGEDEGTYEIVSRIDKDNFRHIDSIITKKQLTTATFDKIVQLNRAYNFKQIGIDAGSGSLGVGILDFLLREPTVKRKIIALNNLKRQMDYSGEKSRKLLKEDMYFNLLALMEKNRIKLLKDGNVMLSLKSVQYEYVKKEGMPTKLRIFGNYAHIVEGLVRAVFLANQKHLNPKITYI